MNQSSSVEPLISDFSYVSWVSENPEVDCSSNFFRRQHCGWFLDLVVNKSKFRDLNPLTKKHYCITCFRGPMIVEDIIKHTLHPLQHDILEVNANGRRLYIRMGTMRTLRVRAENVLSDRIGYDLDSKDSRVIYLFPNKENKHSDVQHNEELFQCEFAGCRRISEFPNLKFRHILVYGVTPKYCSLRCKLKAYQAKKRKTAPVQTSQLLSYGEEHASNFTSSDE